MPSRISPVYFGLIFHVCLPLNCDSSISRQRPGAGAHASANASRDRRNRDGWPAASVLELRTDVSAEALRGPPEPGQVPRRLRPGAESPPPARRPPGTAVGLLLELPAPSGPFRIFSLGKFRFFRAFFTFPSPKGDIPSFPGEKRNEIAKKIAAFLARKNAVLLPH